MPLIADGGVAVAGRDELQDQVVERCGEDDRFAAEPSAGLRRHAVSDVAEGEAADVAGHWA